MGDDSKPSLRIDWFDGTVIEDTRRHVTAQFDDQESNNDPKPSPKPPEVEKKPIGFKRLLELSCLKPPILNLEIANRPGFWHLLNVELKGDFIVLIAKVLADIYASLEPGEKSHIAMLLRSRFEKSDFMRKLKEYVDGLPKVRIVEKRMNMQLWDDVEVFYFNLLKLYEGIYNYGGHSVSYLKDLYEIVEITVKSAMGVQEKHMETIKNEFYQKMDELKLQIMKIITQEKADNLPIHKMKIKYDANNLRNLHIFPTKEDLVDCKVSIQPQIINGAYSSVEHYLDLQFKLLREDCFRPLREGICQYLKNPTKRRHENIRVYPKVRIIRTYVTNNKVGHLVDIAWLERINQSSTDSKKYAYNKRLMFGSLLLFTSDKFQNILVATVLDSSLSLLNEGYIAVSFQNPVSNNIYSETYLMVESEVFFEPYHRVLKVLQSFEDDLPMKKYIVDVQTITKPPAYLTPDTKYSIIDSKNQNEIEFPVLDTSEWPSTESFGLDQSQMDAFTFALTREFAVIQGPPGTGKTFLGVKIASTLLKNLSLEGTPMLVICYTNHALDQFMKGVLEVTTNVVRLGSQSKSRILEPYNLNNLRMKVKSKYFYLYATKRSELEKIYAQMMELQSEIEKCEKGILSYKSIKPYLKNGQSNQLANKEESDAIMTWLFDHLDDNKKCDVLEEFDDWETQYDEVNESEGSEKLETCFTEEWAMKEIDSMLKSIKYVEDVTDDPEERNNMVDKFNAQIYKIQKRLACFKKHMLLVDSVSDTSCPQPTDLNSLSPEQRWRVYLDAVNTLKRELNSKMNTLLEEHNSCGEQLNEVSTLIDSEVMKCTRVVGVTTTVAARRHDLMKKLLSPIVIVEEAAEVLEAHIVASITNKCQHLILIGDHKQLRPTTAHYKLAKDYNLEISLFERMIRNSVHARTLTTQRRMRPNFVELLVPDIYERLDSHQIVKEYKNVRGMRDTLFFFDHNVFEDSEGLDDSWSHKNTFEAKWCVALANYLRQMQYSPQEITILATYTGQMSLIIEQSKKYPSLRDVKITVVDNYQGEENRIVILSLVRSNRDGNIGFLSASNRICVALSRAKEGFYIFGNMDILKSSSPIWQSINEKLQVQNSIGDALALSCENHLDCILKVKTVDELDGSVNRSCLKNCI